MARDGNVGLMEAITGGRGRLLSHLSLLPGLKSSKTITLVITTNISIVHNNGDSERDLLLSTLLASWIAESRRRACGSFFQSSTPQFGFKTLERWRGHKDSKWLVVVGEQG